MRSLLLSTGFIMMFCHFVIAQEIEKSPETNMVCSPDKSVNSTLASNSAGSISHSNVKGSVKIVSRVTGGQTAIASSKGGNSVVVDVRQNVEGQIAVAIGKNALAINRDDRSTAVAKTGYSEVHSGKQSSIGKCN